MAAARRARGEEEEANADLLVREDAVDEVGAPGGAAAEAVDGLPHGLERRRGVDLRPAAPDGGRRRQAVQHLAGHRDACWEPPFLGPVLLGFLGLGEEGGGREGQYRKRVNRAGVLMEERVDRAWERAVWW